MVKHLLSVACEEYGDPKLGTIRYAERDAVEFAKTLRPLGFEPDDQILLANQAATKSSVESRLRRLLSNADEGDVVFLHFVLHAFSQNDANHLLCSDAQRGDLEATSVPLSYVFERIKKSDCRRVALFLDLRREQSGRETLDDPSDDEIRRLADSTDNCVAFVSASAGETSWATGLFNHGIWTRHLIEAFSGEAKAALTKGRYATPDALRDHLREATARSLVKAFAEKKSQTPWSVGEPAEEFTLADLQDVLAKRRANEETGVNQISKATLSREHSVSMKTLSGFNKGAHKVPDRVSGYAAGLIAKLAADDVKEDLAVKHAALKREFKLRRVDLDVSGPTEGSGTIITPYFTYNVSVTQDEEDPGRVVWRRSIIDVKDPHKVLSGQFASVFEKDFDTIELVAPTKIDVEDFIDRIEALDDARIRLNYEPNPTWVAVSVTGVEGELRVESRAMSFVRPGPASPNELAASLVKIQRTLVDERQTPLLSAE